MPSPGLTIFGMAGNYAARRSGIVRGRTVGTQQIAFAAASNGERAPNLARIGQEWPSLVAERGDDHCCRTLRIALADSSDFGMNPATGASSIRSAKSASA